MPGVTVTARGSDNAMTGGSATDVKGQYTITVPANGKLTFSFIGYVSQEITPGGRSTINVTLAEDVEMITSVVVTAMGITKSQKSLGYAATKIDGADLAQTRNASMLSSLQGKVAGLQISSSSSTPGSANSVIIRGFSSLTDGSNQPLFIVDGVPMVNNTTGSASGDRMTYSWGNGANLVNPDDIVSTTVLKGAAATAIYGSRAANGVIMITTKAGRKDQELAIEVNTGVQFSSVTKLPTFQNTFGQGWGGLKTDDENGSWGPAFDGKMRVYGPVYNNSQLVKPYVALPDNIRDFFETGVMTSNSISISGGGEKTTYYTSFSYLTDDGIMPYDKDKFEKVTLSFKGSHDFKKWLSMSSSVNIANQTNNALGEGQGPTVVDGLFEFPRDISVVDLKDLDNPFNQPGYYFTPYGITNPYYALENSLNQFKQRKVYGNVSLNIMPIEDLKLTYRFGFDYTDNEGKTATSKLEVDGTPNSSMGADNLGDVSVEFQRRYEINHDFLANYNKTFGDFEITATVGANIGERSLSLLSTEVADLTIPTFFDLSNSASMPTISERMSLRRNIGVFGDIMLGYKEMLYLNMTARNDWSSTLPMEENSFFYPGITGSFIFTELIPQNDILSFGKLRVAWGKTGNDAGPYKIYPVFVQGYGFMTYTGYMNFPMGGLNGYKLAGTLGSSSLKPEMTTESEIGANLSFLKNRINLDASYYSRISEDQIFDVPMDRASGYGFQTTNIGKISNKGIELVLQTTPIKGKLRWDLDLNFTMNKNKLVSLPEELGGKIAINQFTTQANAVYMYGEAGKPVGTLWTLNTEKSPSGQIVVDAGTGLPINTTETVYSGWDVNNKWYGGVSTSLSYAGVTLSADFDIRQGGHMFSRSKDLMNFTGNGLSTMYNSRRTYIVPNSVNKIKAGDGTYYYVENTTPIDSETVADGQVQLAGGFNGDQGLLLDRSFVKLRNLSLSYDLPEKWISKIHLKALRVSAIANNLFVWTPKENIFIDPESATDSNDLEGAFGEFYTSPGSRKIGFNVQIKF